MSTLKIAGDVFFGLVALTLLAYSGYVIYLLGYHRYLNLEQFNLLCLLLCINAIGVFRK